MTEESQTKDHVDRRAGVLARHRLKTMRPISAVASASRLLRRARGRRRRADAEADARVRRCARVRGAPVERSAHESVFPEQPASWALRKTRAPAPLAWPPGIGVPDRSKQAHI